MIAALFRAALQGGVLPPPRRGEGTPPYSLLVRGNVGRHALMPPGCVRLQQSARGVGDAAPYSTDAPGRRALTRIFTKNIGFP